MKECWNPKTKMMCKNLGISLDGNDTKCAAKGSRVLIGQQGDKKTDYKDTHREPTPNGEWRQVDGDHFINIVCPEGCDCQELYNLRDREKFYLL